MKVGKFPLIEQLVIGTVPTRFKNFVLRFLSPNKGNKTEKKIHCLFFQLSLFCGLVDKFFLLFSIVVALLTIRCHFCCTVLRINLNLLSTVRENVACNEVIVPVDRIYVVSEINLYIYTLSYNSVGKIQVNFHMYEYLCCVIK